jgi:hypothetical protein
MTVVSDSLRNSRADSRTIYQRGTGTGVGVLFGRRVAGLQWQARMITAVPFAKKMAD